MANAWIPLESYRRKITLKKVVNKKTGKIVSIRIVVPTTLTKYAYKMAKMKPDKDLRVKLYISPDGKKLRIYPDENGIRNRSIAIGRKLMKEFPHLEEMFKDTDEVKVDYKITNEGIIVELPTNEDK